MIPDKPNAISASKVKRHIDKLTPTVQLNEHEIARYAVSLLHLISEVKTSPLKEIDLEKLFTYRVPTMDPDGCSRIDGTLAKDPYDLRKVLFDQSTLSANGFYERPETRQVFILNQLVEKVIKDTGVNWLGFYQRRVLPQKKNGAGEVLLKLAYRGAESRAEFPLTREFAEKSNNSTVGLTGQGIIINDIERYLWEEGGPYYQCDSKVHSEACLPVFSPVGDAVVGIIDAESHERNKFSERELTMLVGTCIVLEELLVAI